MLVSPSAGQQFKQTVMAAHNLHPRALQLSLDPARPQALLPALRKLRPRYAMLVMTPREIDVDFAWRWLQVSIALDDDPLVDVRCGFATGVDDVAASALLDRTRAASRGELTLPAILLDHLGPNPQVARDSFQESRSNFMIPVFSKNFRQRCVSYGVGRCSHLESLNGAGLIHLGGHGTPDRIVDGLTARQLKGAKLSPCVVFSGACHTGVTAGWYDQTRRRQVSPVDSFCLQLLQKPVLGYLAALHSDHGMPVYQELEFLAMSGNSLGEVIKHTQDGVILGFGGKLPDFPRLDQKTDWGPSQAMLYGTASRILFGDPALVPMKPIAAPPFEISRKSGLQFTARVKNFGLSSTFTDTYHSDLTRAPAPFNDRALLKIELPPKTASIEPEILGCRGWFTQVPYRLVGYALEREGSRRYAHLQIDVPATGMFQSPLRNPGWELELKIKVR
ncbi:hypothetical protein IV102_18675 [bacterium]|nr:hypothetical protein [bacterium]